MSKIALIVVILLCGCSQNQPWQQVRDMKTCRDGGMNAYQNDKGEIKCAPKPEETVINREGVYGS